jgi:hypothetical protein
MDKYDNEIENLEIAYLEAMSKSMILDDDIENFNDYPEWGEDYSDDALFSDSYEEKSANKPLKDPKGGLTAAGRAFFKRTQGANLKPGVKGPADTPEKMRRKGSFLTRFFTNPRGPMKDEKGKATRLALSAAAWGEPVPQNAEDAAELAAKGRRLLERYQNTKKKSAMQSEEYAYMKLAEEYPTEEELAKYLDSLSDEKFDEMFPEETESKVIFDVVGAYVRRALTNRRKKRKKRRFL